MIWFPELTSRGQKVRSISELFIAEAFYLDYFGMMDHPKYAKRNFNPGCEKVCERKICICKVYEKEHKVRGVCYNVCID